MKPKNARDILSGISAHEMRSTVINWPRMVETVIDGYRSHMGLVHGVQKDGVQNGWDARTDKRHGRNWSYTFKLVTGKRNEHSFLILQDRGTFGLTGRVLRPDELEADLPPDERWGRFENLAFNRGDTGDALGSRGRGKLVFVGASGVSTIIYDTLRSDDGLYRMGCRWVERTESPVASFDGTKGRQRFEEMTGGRIEPLDETGTRVIIVDPVPEVVHSIRSGEFTRYIGETWWEIISKHNARIVVSCDDSESQAQVPEQFILPEKDDHDHKVWLKENATIRVGEDTFRIKRFHTVFAAGQTIDEDLRGVSIQRGGMKVTSVEMKYVPRNIADSIVGYITFDQALDRAMLAEEGIEHYAYDFRKQVPHAVKRYIEDELARFARDKLGIGLDPERVRHERESGAERKAINAVNKIAKSMGIFGRGPGPKEPGPPSPVIPLRLEIPAFDWPNDNQRVNYGQSLRNICVKAVNDTANDVSLRIRMYLLFGDEELESIMPSQDVNLSAQSQTEMFGPFEITPIPAGFPLKGRYTIRAKLMSPRGKEIHILSRHFWLEEDPPESGLFEKCEAIPFPEEYATLMGEAVAGSARGYIYQYNTAHPAKRVHDESENELAAYLVGIMAAEIPWIDIRSSEPKLFSAEEMSDPEIIAHKCAAIVGEILSDYHSS